MSVNAEPASQIDRELTERKMSNTRISMCVTSCDRHDLLKVTLESFYAICDQEPQEILIYEDSDAPMPEFLQDFIWKQRGLRWIAGGQRLGQAFACARLIQEAQFEYTFWCECDWLFQNQIYPFIRQSKAILDQYAQIIMVSLRGNTGWHPLADPDEIDRNAKFKIAQPYWRGVWGAWSWNPSLHRTKDLKEIVLPLVSRQIGQSGLVHEQNVSKALLDMGYRIADLDKPLITHIGGNRSRAIESIPPLPKILIAVPTCFEFDYESHGGGEPCKSTGFHQNGPNEQTHAVRETWGEDVKDFKNVDLKFFYGKPTSGYPRQPLADEVFLECGDGYDSLIHKTVGVCTYAAQNGYKSVYKCDTDTAVCIDKLLIEIMENRFDYAGYLHCNVCSGGPGYLLSEHACQIISTQGRSPRHSYAEDVHVSRVLADAGIRPLMLPNHRPGFSDHFYFWDGKKETFDPSKLRDEVVSMHAVFPEAMRKWYEWIKK